MQKGMPEIEKTTPERYTIKVRTHNNSFIVFKPNGDPERLDPKDPNKIINPLRSLFFLGSNFTIRQSYQGISFLPVKNNRIIVPYTHAMIEKEKAILLHTASQSDELPMHIFTINEIEELFRELRTGRIPSYIVVDDMFKRFDMVDIKKRIPGSHVFLIKVRQEVRRLDKNEKIYLTRKKILGEKFDQTSMRATDILENSGSLELFSNNPTFLARVFLRNLELSKIKSLLLEQPMTIQENMYIQTFLDTMIRNEFNKEELAKVKPELIQLKKDCEFQMLLLQSELDVLEKVILEESDKEVLIFYGYSIKRYKDGAKNKDEEIKFWELEAVVKSRMSEVGH